MEYKGKKTRLCDPKQKLYTDTIYNHFHWIFTYLSMQDNTIGAPDRSSAYVNLVNGHAISIWILQLSRYSRMHAWQHRN